MKGKTKMNKWNWQKIVVPGIKTLNLPPFKNPVLLFERRDEKNYTTVGYLNTIDINGPHWSTGGDIFSEIIENIFTKSAYETNYFKPTHWCEIELPEKDERE
jgi:hypothetical protein